MVDKGKKRTQLHDQHKMIVVERAIEREKIGSENAGHDHGHGHGGGDDDPRSASATACSGTNHNIDSELIFSFFRARASFTGLLEKNNGICVREESVWVFED